MDPKFRADLQRRERGNDQKAKLISWPHADLETHCRKLLVILVRGKVTALVSEAVPLVRPPLERCGVEMVLGLGGRERWDPAGNFLERPDSQMLCAKYLGGAANGPMDIEAMPATSSVRPAGVLRLAQRAEDCGGPH
ncbi:predicted protein [Chaetomium globosum CBS 148.51]|uniref:Uncharacterized protein n=1 Tax=Chaetomium globosum (strain ATCC 6205 / CBS 148.51 / DSM 1962 / NBRC 6347 / NRRL 1970) TaxID=306901 RepID=Q2HH07_CHAGB|nr:uncharacterized protein CHGG_00497 [Chaetomium globosum CBS 148.51]EAQ92262.1 predicted protein [Chaetomium globosum CBS 148.51]